jgi:hypothetical protein
MCTYFLVCLLSNVQYGCYDCVVELVMFYIGGWGVCASVWCNVSNIGL